MSIPAWLWQGKAHLKQQLAMRADLDLANLPWNTPLLDWLRQQRAAGRQLVLATSADVRYANLVAQHLGYFDSVMASENGHNLSGSNKHLALVARFGEGGFDYAGNSNDDLVVWSSARQAIAVNASPRLIEKIPVPVERIFAPQGGRIQAWGKAMRFHQWLKNCLLFLPLLAAHDLSPAAWISAVLGFAAFGLCASSVYLCNDLLDLSGDRRHPRKCTRPFAAGRLPAIQGALMAPCLLLAGLTLAGLLSTTFALILLGYFLLSTLYSMLLKQIAILDVVVLASLYAIRVLAGAALNEIVPSFWLLAFTLFLFLSLAFLKRYVELVALQQDSEQKVPGRGYDTGDASLIIAQGSAAGNVAVLVLTFYLKSPEVLALYHKPHWLWGICILLLYWLNRSWWLAHRGRLHDDPVIYAITDPGSRLIMLMSLGLIIAASLH